LALKEIRVPDLGSFKDVAVIELLVKPGDAVEVDTPLLTLETEKATMDVPSPDAGVIEKLHIEKGGLVSAGSLIATLQGPEDAAPRSDAPKADAAPAAAPTPVAAPAPAAAPAAVAKPAAVASAAPEPKPAPAAAAKASGSDPADTLQVPAALNRSLPPVSEEGIARAHASPSVRKFARELGADLLRIQGSGQKGRITDEDVKAYVKAALAKGTGAAPAGGDAGRPWPAVALPDFAQFGPIEVKPL
jgi:pyruvate dehydrogenase E2 component (dihydrolipoamide acetyltransferase)